MTNLLQSIVECIKQAISPKLDKSQIREVRLWLDEYQIDLIRNWATAEQDNLHDQRREWLFRANNISNKLTFGTTDYDEAQALLDDILAQLPTPENPDEKNMHCLGCEYQWNAFTEWHPELICPKCQSLDIGAME